jgi:hypothetical protein
MSFFVGEAGLDCEDTHDFLLNFDSERAGDSLGELDCLRTSIRPVLGCGSCDGSRLLLEKGRNLDVRREMLGFIWGICSAWTTASESGPELSDKVSDDPFFSPSSEPLPLTARIDGSSRSLTRGKYV